MTVAADHETPANFDLDGLEFFVNEMNANLETMQEKEPEVKDVNKKSDDISAFIEQRGGDPSDVKQKCADTNKQWNDAKEKVTDKRDKSQMFLKQMAQFVEAVDDLDNWVNVSTTTVTNLGPASATPEGVKKQLEQIDILKDEIAGQQAKLAEAEEIGDWLCDESKDKPQFCANVQNKLNKVKKPLDELLSVLSDRKTRLHNVLVANQDFKVAFDDFVSELDKLDNKQTKQKPISVDWKTLKLQDEEQKAVEKEIEVVKPMYEKLMASGDKLVKESEKSPERDALESNLEDAKKRFEGIVKKSTERRDVMDKVIPKSEKFFNDEDDICDWLDVNEKVLQELNVVPVTLDEATKLDKKIDELDKVIAKEEPVYKSTAGSSKDLLASAANENVVRDVPETEKRMDRVTERWEKFKTEKTNKKDRTLRYKTLIQNYNDTADPLKDALAQFEDALDKRPTFGTDTKKAVDELQRIDDLIRKLDTHEPQLKSVDKTNDDLVDLVETDKGDPSRIQFQTDNINDRFKKIKSALDERKNALEKTSRVLVQFNDITKEIGDWCVDTNEQVDTLAPVSKDPEEAQKQIKKIDNLLENLARQRTSVVPAEENGKWLTDNCLDDRNMRPDVRTALSKVYTPLDSLEAKLNERKSKLQNAMMRGQEFDKSFNDINDRISSLEFRAQRQKPVSPVWEEVAKQQQEQKTMVKEVALLKPLYDQLINSADNVISALEPGEEKDATERKVDDIKKQWKEISENVQKRDDLIDEVEPLARSHNNEKQSFNEWIVQPEKTMKELEQVPTTREEHFAYKKEVKDFSVDVENHVPKHELLNDTLSKLANVIKEHPDDTGSMSDIEEDVTRLNKRWDKLDAHTQDLKEKVDKLQAVIVPYHDDYSNAEKVIEDVENALKYKPTFGVDAEQGKKEVDRLDELLKAVEQAKEKVDKTCDDSKDLEKTVDELDGDNSPVKESTKKLTKRLKDVQDDLNKRKADVEKTNKVLAQYLTSLEDLGQWNMGTTQKLVSVGSVKPTPEQVQQQIETVDGIEEDLKRTRPRVQALQDAADWLLENNADDRVASSEIKNKLASVLNPFNECADKINEKQNTLRASLLQTQEFEDTYNTCLDQLAEAEVRLKKEEPLSVRYDVLWKQDENFKAYESDVAQLKPIIEQVEKAGKKVKEATEEKPERDDIDHKVKDLLKRYDDLEKKIKDRRENIDKLSPVAKEEDVSQDTFKPVLKDLEEACDDLKSVPETLQECEKQLAQVKEVKDDIESAKPKHKDLNVKYDKEMGVAKKLPEEVADESVLAEEIEDLNKRWDALQANVKDKQDEVTKLHYNFVKYHEQEKPLEEEIKKYEEFLAQEQPFGLDPEEGKNTLNKVDELLRDVEKCGRKMSDTNRCGKDLADQLEASHADPWPVNAQLSDLNRRYDDVKKQLQDRKEDVVDQVKTVDQFLDDIKSAEDSLQDLTDKCDQLEPVSVEPDVVKEQLAEVEALLDDVASQKPNLQDVDNLSEKVCRNNPDDFSIKSDVKFKVNKVKEPLDRIHAKLVERKDKLQKRLVSSQEVQETLDDFDDKLKNIEKTLSKFKPVSARVNTVKKQQLATEQLYDEVSHLKPSFDLLEKTANKVLKDSEPKEREQLEKKINDLKNRWEESKDKLTDRKNLIEKVVPLAQDYDEREQPLAEWVGETEKLLTPITDDIVMHGDVLEEELDKLKAIKKDIENHKPDMTSVDDTHKPLVEAAEDDTDNVKDEVDSITERYNKLKADIDERWDKYSALKDKLNTVDEQIAPVEETITCCEQALDNQEPVGLDKDRANEQMSELDDLLKNLDDKEDDIKKVEAVNEELMQQPDVDAERLKKKVSDLKDKHANVKENVKDKKKKLGDYIIYIEEYYIIIEEITVWVVLTKKNPAFTEPISTDPETLKKQKEKIEGIQDELIEKKPKVDRAKEIMEEIVEECKDDFTVCTEVSTAFENARKPMEEIETKIDSRLKRLQEALATSQKFQDSFDDFLDSLTHLEERIDKEKPVSAKLDTVKEQKKEHAQVHNDVMQLQPVFERITKAADELIETSEPGEDKENLKKRVDDLKKTFEEMKKKSTDRQKKLADEVTHTQKFEDEEKPFKSWLDTTEAKISSMDPVGCEESTISRQLKDLKDLQREIEEKKPKLDEIEKVGNSAIENADVDQPVVKDELEDTKERYRKLNADLKEREDKLNELLPVAQKYKEQLKPIDELFDKVQHCVSCSTPVHGIDEDKISKEQDKVNELVKEFSDVLPKVKEFNDTGKTLTDKGDEESPEQPAVKKQVDHTNDRYKQLRDQLHETSDKLNDYANKAKTYNSENVDFGNWYDKISKTPSIVEPIGTEPEVIRKQLREVEAAQDEITRKKPVLEDIKDTGDWLVRNNRQDNALKDDVGKKTDNNQEKYDKLATKVEIRRDRLQKALSKCQEFQTNFADFTKTVDDLEKRLDEEEPLNARLEPLKKQKEEHELVHQDLVQTEPVFERIVENGNHLLDETEPGAEKEALQQRIDDTKKKWEEVKDKSYKRKDDIDKLYPLAQAYNDDYVTFSVYLQDAEKRKDNLKPVSADEEEILKQLEDIKEFRKDVDDHKPMYENFKEVNNPVFVTCKELDITKGLPEQQDEVDAVDERWKKLNSDLDEREKNCEDVLKKLADCSDQLKPLEELVEHTQNLVKSPVLFGADLEKGKEAKEKIKGLKDDLEKKKPELEKLKEEIPKLVRESGAAPEPIEEKITALTQQVDECALNLDDLDKFIDDQLDKAKEFNDACEDLKTWLPEAQESPAIKDPVSSEPNDILKQVDEIKALEEEIVKRRPQLETAQKTAAELLEANKNDPEASAAIVEQLNSVTLPFSDLVNKLEEKQKKLATIKKALDTYNKEKEPLEEFITATEQKVDQQEPFGLDVEKGDEQLAELDDLVGTLEKRKPELRAVNRAGQTLIRQLDSPDEIEKELDQLSDKYYEVVDKVKEKQNKKKENLQKVKHFLEIIVILEVYIEETIIVIEKFDVSGTEPEAVKKQLEKVDEMRDDLRKHSPELKEAGDIKDWCHENLKEHPKVLKMVDERMEKVQVPMEEEIPTKLDELEKKLKDSLASSKQFVDDTDEIERWLTKMEKTLEEEKPISADKDTNARQVNDHKYVVEEVAAREPKLEKLLEEGQDLLNQAEPGDEKKALEDKIDDIKKRWEDVKKKTNDRKDKLDEVEDLATKFDDNKSKMLPWLEDMEKKAEPLDCISVDPEELSKQQDTIRELLDELAKQKPVYEDFTSCGEPLSEKPDTDKEPVKECVDDVKSRFDELQKKLKEADDKSEKMKKGIESFDEKRKPVEEICEQAQFAVDEQQPVGDDPVKAQEEVDKLKNLLDELVANKPGVEDVKKAGDELIVVEDKPDNVTAVSQITDALAKKHEDLIDKLKEKIDKSDKANDSVKNFNDKVKETKDKTSPIEEKAGQLEPIGATPEKVKEQLVELEKLQAELQQANNLFNGAEMYGNEIIDFNEDDPNVKKDIQDKLAERKKPLDKLAEELNAREEKLKEKLQECGALQDQIDDFVRRVKNLDDRIDEQEKKPCSMKPGQMSVIMGDLENIEKDIGDEKPVFEGILENGKKLLDSIESPTEKDALQAKLDELTKLWDDTGDKFNKENAKEGDVLEKTKKLDDKMSDLEKFLDDQEKKLRDLEPVACSPKKLDQQQKEINSLQNDTKSKKPSLEDIEELIKELQPECTENAPEVLERLDNLKKHFDEVDKLGDDRQSEISDVQKKVEKFDSVARPTKEKISKIEKTIPELSLYGADKPKSLEVQTELQKQMKLVDDLQAKVDDLEGIAKDLQEHHPTTDSKHLRDEADEVKERLDKLKKQLGEKTDEVDGVIRDWDELENDVKKAVETVKKANDDVENNKPDKFDPEELACQVENIKAVEATLDESSPLFDDIQKRGRKLREKGIGADTFGDQLSTVDNRLRNIQRDIPSRTDELEKLKDQLNDFNEKLKDAEGDMDVVEKKVEEQKPVGGDKETIAAQIGDLKDLVAELDKLQEKVTGLNDVRSDLKSKYPEADSSKVDEPLDKLNERLADVNQKISDRQGKLDDALVNCGQFNDAVQSLLGWLGETEELLDNQKPVSAADQNVLKAQIQEQKLLTRMFADREPSVENLKKSGEELLATTEDEDKKAEIQADLDKVTALWDSLKDRVNERREKLDDTLVAAEKFNKDLDDVLSKLDDLDKKVNSDENVPSADKAKVDEQVQKMKGLNDEAKQIEEPIQAVLEDLQHLEPFCTPEEQAVVQGKFAKLNEKFDRLNDDVQDKEQTLEQAHDLLEDFYNKEKELDDWMDTVEKDLAEKQPNGAEAEKIKKIQKDVVAHKPDVEKLKEIAKELKKVVKSDEYPELKKVVEAVEEKYKKLKADVDEKARDMFMAKEKVDAFDNNLDDLNKWTNDKLNEQRVMEPVSVEPEKIKEQMNEHKTFTAEVNGKEPEFKEVYSLGETILMGCNEEEAPEVKDKISNLKFNKQKLDKATDHRNTQLVEGLILALQFSDVRKDVEGRLTNTENLLKQVDEEKGRGVELQKEKLQNIEDNIKQLQPQMATLEKTGTDLIGICGTGQGPDSVQKKMDDCKERWEALKVASEDKGITVGAAAEQVEAVWGDVESLIEKNQALKQEFKQQKPVPVTEEPIAEEFKTLEEQENKLKDLEEPINAVNKSIDNLLEEDPKSPTSTALKDKQRKLNNLSKFNVGASTDRRKALESSDDAAKKFWPGVEKLKDTLLDVQVKLDDQGEPGIEPEAISEMIKEHDDLHSELESNEDVIATLSECTPVLVSQAAQEDKIKVHKELSEVTDQWDNLENAWKKRRDDLQQVKDLAEEFTKDKDHVEEWLTEAEETLKPYAEIPADVGELRDKLRKLRTYHRDLSKRQHEITKLNQKGEILAEKVNEDDSQKVRDKVDEIEKRWEDLLDKSYDEQQKLEDALIERGQFGVAIDELLVWVDETKTNLTSEEEVPKDKKLIEVELSKLKIIANDVKSHKPTVTSCQEAAQKLVDEDKAQPELKSKLEDLTKGWDEIQELLKEKEDGLQNAFDESRKFQGQVRELNIWLSEAKTFLKSKAPIGAKSETVEKQLDKHKEFVKVIEIREEVYIYIIETFEILIKSSDISGARVLEKAQEEIKTSWSVVSKLSQEKSDKLEDALENSRLLESLISELEVWVVRVEGNITLFSDVSTIYETIVVEMKDFDEIYQEVSDKRENFRTVRKTADKVIENCTAEEAKEVNQEIGDLTEKWKGVNGKLKTRKKILDDNYNESKIFFEGHEQLMTFLGDVENKINSDLSVGKDAPSVKAQMRKHKEYQNELGKKQSKFNATVKAGKTLVDKSQPHEVTIIEEKITVLTSRWDVVCHVSVDRQHQLEEALLFHGMFHDAVQALLDWIDTVEPSLLSETAVMGDVNTVKLLIDNHKAFQRDLAKREKNYDSIVKTGEAMLEEGKVDDVEALKEELDNLKNRWENVGQASVTKQERLQNAFTLAKEFQTGAKSSLDNINSLEDELKGQGPIAEDAPSIKKQQEEFIVFMETLEEEEVRVNTLLKKGEVILRFCHPSALTTIRHHIAVVKKRWNDISGWARQRKTRLDEALEQLLEEEKLSALLLEWLTEQEDILDQREKIPLPDDYNVLAELLGEHKLTQDGAEQKQPDYNKITKNARRKPLTDRQRRAMSAASRGRQDPNASKRDFFNPMVSQLSKGWQRYWLVLMDRNRRLQEKLDQIRIRKAAAEFSWDEWKDRFNGWLRESKSRVLDMWRKNDNDKDNKLTRDQFVHAIDDTSFPAERWEIELVFDQHKRHILITYQDFMDALKGRKRKPDKPLSEAEQIHDIIGAEVSKCCCAEMYKMEKVGEGKYKFGDLQKLRLVRILRSMVMVRVGGGWESLAEFLDKNDPCRAEGRTNYELREKFIMPEHASQGMQAFKSNFGKKEPSMTRDRPSVSREGSSSGIPRRITREKSGGDIKGGRLSVPGMTRKKSDLDREGRNIPSYKSKDYTGVRGSGYGASPKKKSPSADSPMTRTPSQPKISRERSGDVYSRLYGTPKTTAGKTAATPRTSTSTASKSATPRTSSAKTPTKSSVPRRTSSSSTDKETKKSTSTKEPAVPRVSVTGTGGSSSPPKGATTKPRTGGVFERLTTQGTATKKGVAKKGTDASTKTDGAAKRRTSTKK